MDKENIEVKSKGLMEVEAIKEAYNKTAKEQFKLLCRLFKILKARKGARRVGFSSGDYWGSNQMQFEDKFDMRLVLSKYNLEITDINFGEDKRGA